MRYLLNTFLLIAILYSKTVFAAQWDWTFNSAQSTFQGTEYTSGATLKGTFTQLSSGIYEMSVTTSTGNGAPVVGSKFSILYSANLGVYTPPLLSNESGISPGFFKVPCPQNPTEIDWVEMNWGLHWGEDLRSNDTFAYGYANWENVTSTMLSMTFNLSSFSSTDGGQGLQMLGTCQNGIIRMTSSSGFFIGNIWVGASNTMMFFDVDDNAYVGFAPSLIAMSDIQGTYVGMMQDRSQGNAINYVSATIDALGNATIQNIIPSTGAIIGTVQDSLTLNMLNQSHIGLVSGTITRNNSSGNISCATELSSPTILSCIAQSPESNSWPYTLILERKIITSGQGNGGTNPPGNSGSTPPGQGGTPPGQSKKK